ncbi:MAG: hypothetical protein WA949_15170, partial [Phormidesmis sp.]
ESYVVFGREGGFDKALELSGLDGSNGFVLNGIEAGDSSGVSVSGVGDINGDSIDDLIIGADRADPNGNQSGESYVVFGREGGFDKALELSGLDGSNGFVLNGIDANDRSGFPVSGVGDINGDGIDDLIVGAYRADPNGSSSGESYVVFGRDTGFDAALELSELDGSNGFVLNGTEANDRSGRAVSGAGDINGDGIDDLIIGAHFAEPNGIPAGESYVVFGRDTGFDAALNLSGLDGSNGFVLNGIEAGDRSGRAVSGVGDINGDGIDDLIIGADRADRNGMDRAGESYVVFGSDTGFDDELHLSELDGSNGFVLNGIDEFDFSGVSVSGAGDINGDGIDDLIIGASGADPNGLSSGESYVVFGIAPNAAPDVPTSTLTGTSGGDTLIGDRGTNVILGKAGNDFLDGRGGKDFLFGGDDNDTLIGGRGEDSLLGEQGNDVLRGGDGNDFLDGGNGRDSLFGGAGKDTLIGGRGEDRLEGGKGNDILTGGNKRDTFVLALGEGTDTITDFSAQDVIGLVGGLGVGDLSFAGNDIIATGTNEVLGTLIGVDTASLNGSQFVMI